MALVLDAGDKVDEVEKRLLKIQAKIPEDVVSLVDVAGVKCHRIKDPNADGPGAPPAVHWGKAGSYILVAIGNDAMESLMKNVKADAPKWLKPALQRVDVPRRWMFSYTNVEKINGMLVEFAPPEVAEVIQAMGLRDIGTVTGAYGLDEQGMLSRTLIAANTDRGLLGLFDFNGVTEKDLAEVPKDAISCFAMRFSAENLVELFLNLAVQINPNEGAQVQEQMDKLSEAIGVDIRKDLLAGLGDRWLVYAMPGNAGPMVPNMVISVDVRDATGVQKGLTVLKQTMDNQGGPISIGETTVGDRAAYYLKGAPATPAWCLTKDRLIIAAQKSSIAKLLDSPPAAADSLAVNPRLKSLFAKYEKPMMVSYSDAKSGMSTMYQALPMLLNMAAGALEEEGIEFDATNLPPMEDILKHLDSTVGAVHRAEDGIEFVSRKTIPSAGIGAATPVAVALLLPAVQQARGAARRAGSMNNLRQIALGCLNYESATRAFPPGKFGKDGKNGLSWRVAILPYLEEQDLYEQFHLDEPWDSDHNKKLISKMPAVFRSPKSKAKEGLTNYLGGGGKSGVFTGDEGIRFRDLADGSSNTILAVEVDDAAAVIWTKPSDYECDQDDPKADLGGIQKSGFLAVFCDGHTQFITNDVDKDILKALFTRNGGERIPPGF